MIVSLPGASLIVKLHGPLYDCETLWSPLMIVILSVALYDCDTSCCNTSRAFEKRDCEGIGLVSLPMQWSFPDIS